MRQVESALEYMYSGEYNLAHAMQIDAAKDLLQFAIMYVLFFPQ
jgi:hypothetical protein